MGEGALFTEYSLTLEMNSHRKRSHAAGPARRVEEIHRTHATSEGLPEGAWRTPGGLHADGALSPKNGVLPASREPRERRR